MNTKVKTLLLQLLTGLGVAIALLFASSVTSQLNEFERNVHGGATREPQVADPAGAFLEIILESSPLAQLSAGFVGIAPSMHMIRLSATRPLSNLDPIENPARRRFGRIDFSFVFLVLMPIALIPLFYVVYRKCSDRNDLEKLKSGRTKLFDFAIESILLPLFASGGFIFLVTLACLYSGGIRLGSNELLARITLWALVIVSYLLGWMLLFAFLVLRSKAFASATIWYAAIFLGVVIVLPQLMQTIQLSIERPKGRLPLIVERRKLMAEVRSDDRAAMDRFLSRQGFKAMNWTEPLPNLQALALQNLIIEDKISPKLKDFEANVQRLDNMAIATAWVSPYLVAQIGLDDLAGTGLTRYSRFRAAAIAYHEQWRNYALGFVVNRQFFDFDAMRNIPKFKFADEELGPILTVASLRCVYLVLICLLLGFGVMKELEKILPKRKKAAR